MYRKTTDSNDLHLQKSKHTGDIAITMPNLLYEKLYNACDERVEAVGEILKERAKNVNKKRYYKKRYYKALDFLWENWEGKCCNSLLDIIKESLSKERYREALKILKNKGCDIIKESLSMENYKESLGKDKDYLDTLMKCRKYFDIDYPSNTLKDILDGCIKESSSDRHNECYALEMDLKIFSPKESWSTKNENDFIVSLRKSQVHDDLWYHPIITSFLLLKWQKVKHIWYLNYAFNILFYLSICSYIFNRDNPILFGILITIGLFFMVREIMQFRQFTWDYLQSLDNILDVSILGLTCTLLCIEDDNTQYSISAWLVVFIAVESLLIVEKMHLPSISLYISMFRKVTYNYVKFTILLSLMVLAFAVSFSFILPFKASDHETIDIMNVKNATLIVNQNTSAVIRWEFQNITESASSKIMVVIRGENQNKTKLDIDWKEAILKTVMMSTGEFLFTDLDFDVFPASRLLFVVFIFLIFLVAMNLLNGIAINDMGIIQKDATKYLVKDYVDCIIFFDNLSSFFCCLGIWGKPQIFDVCFPSKVITLYPNRHPSASIVRCEGHHNDNVCTNILYYLFVKLTHFIYNKLFDFNICQDCSRDCSYGTEYVYKHHYMISHYVTTIAKERLEKIEKEEDKKERKKKMSNIEDTLLLLVHACAIKEQGSGGGGGESLS